MTEFVFDKSDEQHKGLSFKESFSGIVNKLAKCGEVNV